MKSDVFLLGLKLDGKRCLVVGETDEAARRVTALLDANALVRVVTTTPAATLSAFEADARVEFRRESFVPEHFDGVWLAVFAERDSELAARVSRVADERRVFFCAVDQPPVSSFSHVALARSGPITVGISTAGRAPALARRLREELQRLFARSGLEQFVERLAELRNETASADRARVLGEAVREVRLDGELHFPPLGISPKDPE